VLTYEPGDTLAHRLDPRAKLAVQAGFAAAAFAHTTPRGLAVLTAVAAGVAAAADRSPLAAVRAYRGLLPFLAAGPVLAAVRPGPPWVDAGAAADATLASYRVLVVLVVSDAYVATTPVRATRAAIAWAVPGRPGRLLATGVGFVFRFLPVLRRDLGQVRAAMAARLGDARPLRERMALAAAAGLRRAFRRADRFALALRARCFAYNPTPPPLALAPRDAPALALAGVLAASVLL
jgi:biotin transport system permease protein